jgi:hypothetical protein
MIRRTLLMATAMITSVGISACSDTTAPRNDKLVTPSTAAQHIEVTFTKWIAGYPAMTGFTSYGANTFAGEILSLKESKNGVILRLQARYEVTDPSGRQSFKAIIKGQQNNKTGRAVLNGVITEGWRIGARVHVTYQVITPCPQSGGEAEVCFQGTIRIQREHENGDD